MLNDNIKIGKVVCNLKSTVTLHLGVRENERGKKRGRAYMHHICKVTDRLSLISTERSKYCGLLVWKDYVILPWHPYVK